MSNVVGIQYKTGGKTYFFENDIENISIGEDIIVETEKGLQYGNIKKIIDKEEYKKEVSRKTIRLATIEDTNQEQKNNLDAARALHKAINLSKTLNLDMDFVDSNYNFERTQLIFFFVSENRVDFRELAKSLASIYRTRIELRQIGIRDKAKETSGIGICGRKLCCSSFLNDLDSVSISMAKNQNLALNPSKINGCCGRLLCCLNYEDEIYFENRKCMPEIGEKVRNNNIEGMVVAIDILNKKYTLVTKDKEYISLNACDKSNCENCEKKYKNK